MLGICFSNFDAANRGRLMGALLRAAPGTYSAGPRLGESPPKGIDVTSECSNSTRLGDGFGLTIPFPGETLESHPCLGVGRVIAVTGIRQGFQQ